MGIVGLMKGEQPEEEEDGFRPPDRSMGSGKVRKKGDAFMGHAASLVQIVIQKGNIYGEEHDMVF